ncbi:hypothetical protein Y032_0071g541 [Ancylostoma ceylanicum]|uniref:Uncharacterized protein n=1 Tax=Ancylostoma ceylanicum TaxID=53326 RepID=A0A016TX91_9BILA|nr:hypothetical protein Y032_0071g541 [Ancylostoma ceylanicum]
MFTMEGLVKETDGEDWSLMQMPSIPIKIPFRDCPTRWGSAFTLICDILDSLPAFEELLTSLKMDPFEEEEARSLRAMNTFLEPFSHMTKQVCSQRATCSMDIAVGQTLIKKAERSTHSTPFYFCELLHIRT